MTTLDKRDYPKIMNFIFVVFICGLFVNKMEISLNRFHVNNVDYLPVWSGFRTKHWRKRSRGSHAPVKDAQLNPILQHLEDWALQRKSGWTNTYEPLRKTLFILPRLLLSFKQQNIAGLWH